MGKSWGEKEMVYVGTAGRSVWLEDRELRAKGVGYEVEEVGRSQIIQGFIGHGKENGSYSMGNGKVLKQGF